MTQTAEKTRFDEEALAALPGSSSFVHELRKKAFEEFQALPTPSQDTEEWRYTDLSGFELSFTPFATGGGPEAVNKPAPEALIRSVDFRSTRTGSGPFLVAVTVEP